MENNFQLLLHAVELSRAMAAVMVALVDGILVGVILAAEAEALEVIAMREVLVFITTQMVAQAVQAVEAVRGQL
jgi:hypothetical protein